MKSITTVKARARFSEVINDAAFGKNRILLVRRNKGIAGVVPVEELLLLEELEARLDLEAVEKALADPENKGSIPWDQLKREVGL
jgi:prevent-host-death family protein